MFLPQNLGVSNHPLLPWILLDIEDWPLYLSIMHCRMVSSVRKYGPTDFRRIWLYFVLPDALCRNGSGLDVMDAVISKSLEAGLDWIVEAGLRIDCKLRKPLLPVSIS